MNYITVNQLIKAEDSIQAKNYLKELWYAIAEKSFSLSLNYEVFTHQLMHLRASAPVNWRLNWDGTEFSLSREIKNHGTLAIIAKPNGSIIFKML